jgi:hypothetical protein
MDVQTKLFDQEECDQMDAIEPGENVSMEPMDVDPGPAATDPAQSHVREDYPNPPDTYPSTKTFMRQFDQDPHAAHRTKNLYYPFASRGEWQLGFFLISCGMSMNLINQFLRLELVRFTIHSAVFIAQPFYQVRHLSLSFNTAKELRARVELLPSGPPWQAKPMQDIHPTKSPVTLYYRNPLECVQSLLQNPCLVNELEFAPYRVYQSAEKAVRVYSEWMSGDHAWEMQVGVFIVLLDCGRIYYDFQTNIPPGASLIGTILSSDKTNITAMTGGRIAHPLLISLANIKMEYRAKGSHHAYLLLALLPIPKFIEKNSKLRGVLENRLVHACLDLILEPLKMAAIAGAMLNDPRGFERYSFTPIAAYIVDTPEAQMISCVGGKTSHLTMASYKQFGDPYPHEPRTGSTTLAKLAALLTKVDPVTDIQAYVKEATTQRLNGVDKPFWRDWALADPAKFFPPEPLHHWHKMFWDHDFKWCIRALGNEEIDFRFSVLHPHTGFRHFGEGVSGLKQVTGRDHRNLQRYVVGVIAGAAPDDFIVAVRSLLDFRYLAQARVIDDNIRDRI